LEDTGKKRTIPGEPGGRSVTTGKKKELQRKRKRGPSSDEKERNVAKKKDMIWRKRKSAKPPC